MSGWMETTLGTLVRDRQASLLTGPFGTALKADEYQTHGTPLVSVREIKDGRIVIDNSTPRLGPATLERLPRYLLREGDIVFGRKGAIERSAQISKSQEGYFLGSDGICLRFVGGIHAAFVAYQIRSRRIATWLMANAGGTTMPSMNQTVLDRLPLVLPPLPTQRRIAAVLSALDDKIELNNRINANLEAQAQALFRSWFVDFEPWGGTMPEGWREGKLEELGKIVGGGTPSKANAAFFASKGIAWLTPKDLSIDKAKFRQHGEQDISPLGLSSSGAQLMPKGTVLFSSRAPIGYIAIATGEVSTNQGFKSVIPNKQSATPFIYYWLKSNVDEIEARASGSTFPEISGTGMKNLPVLVPDEEALDGFGRVCEPLFVKQWSLEKENRTLSAIRDTLLPKLMSGEIDVAEVELPA